MDDVDRAEQLRLEVLDYTASQERAAYVAFIAEIRQSLIVAREAEAKRADAAREEAAWAISHLGKVWAALTGGDEGQTLAPEDVLAEAQRVAKRADEAEKRHAETIRMLDDDDRLTCARSNEDTVCGVCVGCLASQQLTGATAVLSNRLFAAEQRADEAEALYARAGRLVDRVAGEDLDDAIIRFARRCTHGRCECRFDDRGAIVDECVVHSVAHREVERLRKVAEAVRFYLAYDSNDLAAIRAALNDLDAKEPT